MFRSFAILGLLSCVSPVGAIETIDVVLVAGQSNAVGADAAPEKLPADPLDAQVKFWWRCGDPPPDSHDSASGQWLTLQAQPLGNPITPRQGRQYGNFLQPTGGFGPEIGLARTLVANSDRPLAIIKVAFSGTHVDGDWDPNLKPGDPGVTEQDCRGACYRSLVHETRQALQALTDFQPRLVGLVWVQGESDAAEQRVASYQQNLTELFTALRTDLAAPELIVLLGVNTKFGADKNPFMPGVIAAQQAYAATDRRARYVDTEGASLANEYHFDAEGTLEVGQRFAQALLELQAE
jgi:Carbohydrate esterase, sialic acid-specific acetylesterase